MANLVYKRSTTTSLKTAGLIDVEIRLPQSHWL